MPGRLMRLLPGLWAGLLLCVAGLAAPAAFATLPGADAGKVVGWLFRREAWISLSLAAWLLAWRWRGPQAGRAADAALLAGAAACTLLGYFALQPWMAAARAGQGPLGFGALHAMSTVFFGVKALCVLVLAWRTTLPTALAR
jgi:hypothetical protein